VELIFTDHGASGVKASRPEWDKCLNQLRKGDVLTVTKLDRVGRSVTNLMQVLNDLKGRGVDLVCLDQAIDTTTPAGKAMFGILAVFSEFEHDLIVERTKDGLAATTARGRQGGRKARLSPAQKETAKTLRDAGKSVREIGAILGGDKPVSRQTVYRALDMIDS